MSDVAPLPRTGPEANIEHADEAISLRLHPQPKSLVFWLHEAYVLNCSKQVPLLTFCRCRPCPRNSRLALHRTLTVWGVDRRLFFFAPLMGAATFNLFYSFLAGLLTFTGLYLLAVWTTKHDPQMRRTKAAVRLIRDASDDEPWARSGVP